MDMHMTAIPSNMAAMDTNMAAMDTNTKPMENTTPIASCLCPGGANLEHFGACPWLNITKKVEMQKSS